MTTFVSLGNATQPFPRLIDAVAAIIPQLPQPVVVQYGNTSFHGLGCVAQDFLEMEEFGRYVNRADVLIMHAGAGSVIHAVRAGKIPVVMPRLAMYGEVVDDHQLEFARALERAGQIVIVEEPSKLLDAVAEAMSRKLTPAAPHQTPHLVDLVGTMLRDYAKTLK